MLAGSKWVHLEPKTDVNSGTSTFPIDLECQLDNATYTPCQSPMTLSNLALGSTHTISVEAIDRINQAIAACGNGPNSSCLVPYTESAPDIGVASATFTVGSPTSTTSSDCSPQTTIDRADAPDQAGACPTSGRPRAIQNHHHRLWCVAAAARRMRVFRRANVCARAHELEHPWAWTM